MQIRFGYVAMALGIPQGSPNKTTTVFQLAKIKDRENQLSKLSRLARENLNIQMRVLRYNAAHHINVFRITSHLIPLATHTVAHDWDYCEEFREELFALGKFVKTHGVRISAHPDHYTILNSPAEQVVETALADLRYHVNLFEAMELGTEAKLVLHVGGLYKNKSVSLERFKVVFWQLPDRIRNRIIVENDDKSYTARDVLALCREIGAPMVLDVHHHKCCNDGIPLEDILPEIFATWGTERPKIHFSSSKEGTNSRAHADYIEGKEFLKFLNIAKKSNRDFDVMVEAKQKDLALFALMAEIEKSKKVNILNEAAIEY